MTRLLLLTPFLAACVHTPLPCEWPRTCEERRDAVQAIYVSPPASKPVDDSNGAETGDKSRDDNGDSSDDNGGSSEGNSDDGNGGKSHE